MRKSGGISDRVPGVYVFCILEAEIRGASVVLGDQWLEPEAYVVA